MALNVQALEQGRNLRAAAVHHHKAHALFRKLGKVGGKGRAEVGLVHGVSAVFDNDCSVFHLFGPLAVWPERLLRLIRVLAQALAFHLFCVLD